MTGPARSTWRDHWTGQTVTFDSAGRAKVELGARDAMLLRPVAGARH